MRESHKPAGAIFDAALDLPSEQRPAYLQEACSGDDALRQRVEALIRAHELAGRFMDGPALQPNLQTLVVKPTEPLGNRIGRYKLLQQIGEGGCGVVYMAEQEEPVRRRIALKVIKLGMDTKNVIARFEAERQALALMDHPNIAKVLEAGATDTGRPYFVMELVRGIKITDYCNENSLSTLARLELFIQVCQAIQHAHQKGIIHRDIKPSNILVADHDGKPVPKIIDFGIAKATTDQRLTDKTLFTAFEQFIGTPAYMSPEQARLSGLDIDTRSDIYSLGVLLYELLMGKTPFESDRLLKAGLDEIRRIIREDEPLRPSTRLQALDAAEQTTVARHRQTDPPRLAHLIRGDLDWIVMKCLEKDRARRYETANGLAADIQRHLSNEPVNARPPSAGYRLQKSWQRNKTAFAVATLIAAVLMAATAISAWQAVRANHQARRALQAEALAQQRLVESKANEALATQRLADSEAISKFLTEVFQSPDPARNGRAITMAETLGAAAKKLETDLATQPARRAKLQATLGETYYALGLYREAVSLQEKVRDYYLATSGLEHTNSLTAMGTLANYYYADGRRDEGQKLQEQVLALRLKVNGPENLDTLGAMQSLAVYYTEDRRHEEALKLRERVLEARRKMLGPEDPATLTSMSDLAISYDMLNRRAEALKLSEKVVDLSRKVNGPTSLRTLRAMQILANMYYADDRAKDGLELWVTILDQRRKINGPEHAATLDAMCGLAYSLEDAGREAEALKLREEELAIRRKVYGDQNPDTINSMNNVADSYCSMGRANETIDLAEKACALDPKDTFLSLRLGIFLAWFGRDADYESTRWRLVQEAEGTDQAGTADKAAKVACLRPSTNAVLLMKVLNLERQAMILGQHEWYLPWYHLGLGIAEYRNGQYADAEPNLMKAEQIAGIENEILGTARFFRAMSLFRQNKLQEARALFSQAEAQMVPCPKEDHQPPVYKKPVDQDRLVCWLAYKEAKALIEGPSVPTAKPSGSK